MSRFLAILCVAAISSVAALAADPPPATTPEGRRAEDRALRSEATREPFRKQLDQWRGTSSEPEDAEFEKRVDRILREETSRGDPDQPAAPKDVSGDNSTQKESTKSSRDGEAPAGAGGATGPSSAALGAFLWAVAIVVSAIVLAAIIYAIVNASLRSRSRPPAESEPVEPGPAAVRGGVAPPIRREPDEWLAEARRLAAAGRWLEALRCLLFASLERLHRARLVDYERARTNRECVRTFRGPEDRKAQFRSLVDAFDATVYGEQPFGEAEFAKAEAAARDLGKGAGDESGA